MSSRFSVKTSPLADGDDIVFVGSTGLHANGASLARLVASQLEAGFQTPLPSGRSFGEALLTPAPMYSSLVSRLVDDNAPIHYLSHITGHGMLKLMRPRRAFTYEIQTSSRRPNRWASPRD